MLKEEEQAENVRRAFAVYSDYVRMGGKSNQTDTNIFAENFVAGVLNIVYGWHLLKDADQDPNAKCIDSLDTNARVALQVTSEKGVGKINNTILCMCEHEINKRADRLIIFTLVPKQKSYAVNATCPGVVFNPKKDVLAFDDVLACAVNVGGDMLARLHEYVSDSMPGLFKAWRAHAAAQAEALRAGLVHFERAVLEEVARYEDPALMYRAIQEMRQGLQKKGNTLSPNELARKAFSDARKILQECERAVQDRFPKIHDAVIRCTGGYPVVEYEGSEHNDAIDLMMEIRPELSKVLAPVREELKRLDGISSASTRVD